MLLKTDSLKALHHVKGTLIIQQSDSYVIRDLLHQDWDIGIRHARRKCNRIAL